MDQNLTDSDHIKVVSACITAYKRKVHIARPTSATEYVVQLQQLLEDHSSTVEWFNHKFPSNLQSESWLLTEFRIGCRNQQGRGGRREMLIRKESSFKKKDVFKFLDKKRKTKSQNTAVPVPSGNTFLPLSVGPSSLTAVSPTPPAAVLPVIVASPAGHSLLHESSEDGETEATVAETVMETTPATTVAGGGGDGPVVAAGDVDAAAPALLLKRLLKKRVSYDNVSKRNKQRVRRILADEICNRIRKSVAVDEENITCSDILRDIADSVDQRSKKRKRADAKQALARQPLVQKLVAEYSSATVSKKERKRILSTISREFSLKELNNYVFSVNAGTKVEQ